MPPAEVAGEWIADDPDEPGTAFQNGMNCDQSAVLEDVDLVGERMDLNRPTARGIRDAVGITTNADHAFPRHATLKHEKQTPILFRQTEPPLFEYLLATSCRSAISMLFLVFK